MTQYRNTFIKSSAQGHLTLLVLITLNNNTRQNSLRYREFWNWKDSVLLHIHA